MKTKGFFAALAFVSLAVTACAPGVQPLLDEYNALFATVTERGQDAGQEGGMADGWLQDTYDVPVSVTLNLHAPEHCTSYEWKLEPYPGIVPVVPLPSDFDIEDWVDRGSRSWLKVDLKTAKIRSGTYLLTSTVVRHGETLRDTSKIIVVEEEKSVSGSNGGES